MQARGDTLPPPSGLVRLFVEDRFVLGAIALNALVLAGLLFDMWRHHVVLEALDYVFTTYFVFEAVFKIRRQTWKGYISQGWNRFDFAIVLFSLPSYLVVLLHIPDLSFLLLLRVVRIAKFFRFLRFVPDIGNLIDGARRAIRASLFVIIAFFLFNFVLALLSCHLFYDDAPEYFGDPLVSFYSIFKVFTVEGWYEIPDAISEDASPVFAFFVRVYFMAVVVSGGLLGLSLINAIFVDEMMRDDNDEIERRLDDLSDKLDVLLAHMNDPNAGGRAPGPDDGQARDRAPGLQRARATHPSQAPSRESEQGKP